METFFDFAALVCGLLLIVLILLQTRGASLGAGLGGGGDSGGTVRRGSEKTIHQITIILVVCFAVALMAGFLV